MLGVAASKVVKENASGVLSTGVDVTIQTRYCELVQAVFPDCHRFAFELLEFPDVPVPAVPPQSEHAVPVPCQENKLAVSVLRPVQ